jgi:excisionase family DNA binding protein
MHLTLNAAEAARLVGRDESTVREWIQTGRLRAAKAGARWRIDMRDLAVVPNVRIDPLRLGRYALRTSGTADAQTRVRELERSMCTLESDLQRLLVRLDRLEQGHRGRAHGQARPLRQVSPPLLWDVARRADPFDQG